MKWRARRSDWPPPPREAVVGAVVVHREGALQLAAGGGGDLGGAGLGDAEVATDGVEVFAVEPAGDDVPLAVLELAGGAAEVDADVGGGRR